MNEKVGYLGKDLCDLRKKKENNCDVEYWKTVDYIILFEWCKLEEIVCIKKLAHLKPKGEIMYNKN